MSQRSLLLVFRRAPYGGSSARAGLDFALAAAAFEQPVSLLFMDEGVWLLQPGQDAAAIGARSIEKTLASLPLYDIESLYVDAESALRHGLDPAGLPGKPRAVAGERLAEFTAGFDQVVVF